MASAATLTLPPAAPSALELLPTMPKEINPKIVEPTPAATEKVADIAKKQRDGDPPADILASLAPDAVAPTGNPIESTLTAAGAITSPEIKGTAAPVVANATEHAPEHITPPTHESAAAAPLPTEKHEDTAKINQLLRDAVNHLVGRHDERFVMMASAMAASPTKAVGNELRRNALITLRDLKPRTGLWGLIDRKSHVLAQATSEFVTKADHHSSTALAAFLNGQRDALEPDLRDELLPPQLLTKIRTGEMQLADVINHFPQDRRPILQQIAENLHHEATGNPDVRMPTLSDPREMLVAAGVDNLWNRLQLKQMLRPEQFNMMETGKKYGPIAFILFMSILQLFPQEQKQQPMGH